MAEQLRKTPKKSPTRTGKPASHDSATPAALIDFMMQGWKGKSEKPPPKVKGAARFKARRKALSKAFPGETLIIPTGKEKVRANDTFYPFRPGSDFYYLSGNLEPDCVLVLHPKRSGGHDDILFVEPNPGRSDATFFTDRTKGELWVGPRLGVAESHFRYGVDRAEPLTDLPSFVAGLRSGAVRPHRVLRGFDNGVDAVLPEQKTRDRELASLLSEMRLIKDEMEVAALKRACESTRRGFEDVIRRLKTARTEREVEGVFNLRARIEGNDVGYNTIAASGANACILHWTRNDGRMRKVDLLLLDAGVETNELYTADVTRTLPIGGKFTVPQREIYDLVLEAQKAATEAVKPGNDFMEPNRVAMKVLAVGLERLKILPMSAEEALQEQNQFYRRYSLHNVSHMLGLDVHDCAQARQETYRYGALVAGMVLTIEPGLYFQKDDLTVPARYRGIGIRIEDDVLVTKRGYKILSDLPRERSDIERWMRDIWRRQK